MRKLLAFWLILAFLLGWFIFSPSASVLAQSGTDVIREYYIDIQPQDNGDLINTYSINWCVISDAAGPLGEIYVGMPNSDYEVLEFMGDIKGVRAANAGTYAQVLVSLSRTINAPECVSFAFTVRQEGIAHQDKATQEIGFQFIPGWFDQVPVEDLRITWVLPEDETLLKSVSPEPTSQEEGEMVWESALEESDKFPINLLYDHKAFPNFGKESSEPIWPLNRTPAASASATETVDDSSSSTYEEGEPLSSSLLTFPSFGVCVCAVILVILVIIIILISISNGIGGYRGGGYIGGPRPPSGGGWILGGGSSRSGGTVRTIPPSRSGGGGGLFGGRGSSCACVSCACACACAGGGRAGCSRKGFDISKLEMLAAKTKKQP